MDEAGTWKTKAKDAGTNDCICIEAIKKQEIASLKAVPDNIKQLNALWKLKNWKTEKSACGWLRYRITTGVFRRYHVSNDPINYFDPFGLYECVGGANCDFTQSLVDALKCFDKCTKRDTKITCGKDSHPEGDPHMSGEAADIGRNTNSDLSRDSADKCYAECFSNKSYAQEEENKGSGTHFHVQVRPGKGGATGFPPGVKPHGPAKR